MKEINKNTNVLLVIQQSIAEEIGNTIFQNSEHTKILTKIYFYLKEKKKKSQLSI